MNPPAAGPPNWLTDYRLAARLTRHGLLWLFFGSFDYLLWRGNGSVTGWFVVKDSLATVVGFYFFWGVALPRFARQGRWVLSGLSVLGFYYVWALVSYAAFIRLINQGLPAAWHEYVFRIVNAGLWQGVFGWYGISIGLYDFSVTALVPILLLSGQWLLTSSNQSLRLERENLQLEIQFLKAQINPHFLFNTLNTIYALIHRQDKRTSFVVQHLTRLLHYTVYQSDAQQVPLVNEIQFLTDYVELERLRHGGNVRITYQVRGHAVGLQITPLLLFPFVENAFKHGVDGSLEACWVAIELIIEDTQLHLTVSNSVTAAASASSPGGLGLENVKKRLRLHYPTDQYCLTSQPGRTVYQVDLWLRLAPGDNHLVSLT